MKITLILLAGCAVFAVSFAAQAVIPPNAENPGKCIFEEKELKQGKNDFDDKCISVYCNEDGSMLHETCSPFTIGDCTQGDIVDVSLAFPHCCKRYFTCKDGTGAEIIKEFSPYSE